MPLVYMRRGWWSMQRGDQAMQHRTSGTLSLKNVDNLWEFYNAVNSNNRPISFSKISCNCFKLLLICNTIRKRQFSYLLYSSSTLPALSVCWVEHKHLLGGGHISLQSFWDSASPSIQLQLVHSVGCHELRLGSCKNTKSNFRTVGLENFIDTL